MWKNLRRSARPSAILAVTAFLVLPAQVQTQFSSPVAVITANLGHDGGTTGTINTTGANLLVACVSALSTGTPTIADSKTNSWSLAASSLLSNDAEIYLFYSVPTTVGSGHTFTVSGSSVLASINVMAWAGATASPLDQTAGAGSYNGTSLQPGTVTPTQNGELLISCLTNTSDGSSSSRSINDNFTIAGQIGQNATANYTMAVAGAYRVQTAAAAANPTWSYPVDDEANAVIASFKTTTEGSGSQFSSPVAGITANLGYNGGTTGTINTTGANLLVACVSALSTGTPTISDSKNNSWNLATSSLVSNDGEIYLFYSVPTTVGSGHTFTVSGQAVLSSIDVTAWAGAHASPLDDTADAGQFSGTSLQPGAVTPTQNGELLITCLTNEADFSSSRSINGNFTISGQIGENSAAYSKSVAGAYLVQTTAAAANPTWSYSVSDEANAVIATFKTAEGGSGGDELGSKPLFQEADLDLQCGFKGPSSNDLNRGQPLAYYDDPIHGDTLYVGVGGQGSTNQKVVQISIVDCGTTQVEASMSTATLHQAATVVGADFSDLGAVDISRYTIWGLLVHDGRLVVSSGDYYDADGAQRVSHFANALNFASPNFEGWKALWDNTKSRHFAGPMAAIPDYAQAAFGGKPVMATGVMASIIAHLSVGTAAFPFDPAAITGTVESTIAGNPAMYYTGDNEMVEGAFTNTSGPTNIWNRASGVGGAVIPYGTRSLLIIMAHGTGEPCYGHGTADPELHGEPVPMSEHHYCYNPDAVDGQGEHAYPNRMQILAFDLLDLAQAYAGIIDPWDVQPYNVDDPWVFTLPVGPWPVTRPTIGGVAYDPSTKSIWMSQFAGETAWRNVGNNPLFWKFTHP